jgi:3-deoxy-manno-octulosonate cytidylyltransferase (CMP-KDO synthetase)
MEAAPEAHICVVTEDDKVADCVKQHGYPVLIDRNKASSGTEKIVQVMDQIDADRILDVQGDEPVVSKNSIRKMIEASIAYPHDVLQAYHWCDRDDLNSVKIVADRSNKILYISRQNIPTGAETFMEHVGIFSYNRDHLETYGVRSRMRLEGLEDVEQLRFLELGETMLAIEVEPSHPVDSIADIPIVERIVREEEG